MLQSTANRMVLPPQLEEEQRKEQFIELLSQGVKNTYQDLWDEEIARTVQEEMMWGHLTSYYTPHRMSRRTGSCGTIT